MKRWKLKENIQKLNQDSSLLDITGYDPSTTKWTFKYDKKGNLIREYEFLNANDVKLEIHQITTSPNNTNKKSPTIS